MSCLDGPTCPASRSCLIRMGRCFTLMRKAGRAGFAVQGKEITALNIFIFDNLDDWEQMESEGMNSSAAERTVIAKEILVD